MPLSAPPSRECTHMGTSPYNFTVVKDCGWSTFPNQNPGLNSALTLSLAPYFENDPPWGFLLYEICTIGAGIPLVKVNWVLNPNQIQLWTW